MANNTYLVLTDGTTTVTIADGSGGSVSGNYRLVDESWSPAVAGLRRSQLGGVGPYEDVAESMDIAVSGSSVAACFSYISTLTNLINQSEQWYRGDNVNPVLIKYSPRGGTVSSATSPLQAAIIGRAGDSLVTLPPTIDDGNSYKAGVRLNFVRRGLWAYGTTAASSGSVANPGLMTVSLSSHDIPSPFVAQFRFSENGKPDSISPWFFLFAKSSDRVFLAETSSGTASGFVNVADAGNSATGGSVLRHTATATTGASSGYVSLSGFNTSSRRVSFFAAVRNNSGSATWTMKLGAACKDASNSDFVYSSTSNTIIDTATTNPRHISLGTVSIPNSLSAVMLGFAPSTASGSPTIDVDYIVALAADDVTSGVITNLSNTAGAANPQDIYIDHQILTGTAPIVKTQDSSLGYYSNNNFIGDATLICSGSTICSRFLGRSTGVPASRWIAYNTAAISTNLAATRTTSYLSPV